MLEINEYTRFEGRDEKSKATIIIEERPFKMRLSLIIENELPTKRIKTKMHNPKPQTKLPLRRPTNKNDGLDLNKSFPNIKPDPLIPTIYMPIINILIKTIINRHYLIAWQYTTNSYQAYLL